MELWQLVDWKYKLKRPAVGAFARTFRVKLGKSGVLEAIAPPLCRSKYWITFDQNNSPYVSLIHLVNHLVETYGLGVEIDGGALRTLDGERSWGLPTEPKDGARAMAILKRAEPRLEPRPYVKNGSSDALGWAVFSSTDWAELEAADVYATRALFPVGGEVPEKPRLPKSPERRQRHPEHEELLAWVRENKDVMVPPLVAALEKLETSGPSSTEERDAMSQIYRIGRRARR